MFVIFLCFYVFMFICLYVYMFICYGYGYYGYGYYDYGVIIMIIMI